MRFANAFIEPVFNRDHVDSIQIDVPERLTIEGRAGFYEATGCLKDMVTTHLLQVLGFVTMDAPVSLTAGGPARSSRRGLQVRPAARSGDVVTGSTRAIGTSRGWQRTPVETLVAAQVAIDSWRWSGVPIFLRTGRRWPPPRDRHDRVQGAAAAAVHQGRLRARRPQCPALRHRRPAGCRPGVPRQAPRPGHDRRRVGAGLRPSATGRGTSCWLPTSGSSTTPSSATRRCSRAPTASSGSGRSPRRCSPRRRRRCRTRRELGPGRGGRLTGAAAGSSRPRRGSRGASAA